jgi:hypothetical protein
MKKGKSAEKKVEQKRFSFKQDNKTLAGIAIFAAFLVLFATFIRWEVSLVIAVVFIILVAIYKYKKRQ